MISTQLSYHMRTMFQIQAAPSLTLPRCLAFSTLRLQASSFSAHTPHRLPPHTSHLHVATADPLESTPYTPASTALPCLLSHQRSPAVTRPPTPTSRQTSPLPRAQISPSLLLGSFCSPFAFLISYSNFTPCSPAYNIWVAPRPAVRIAVLGQLRDPICAHHGAEIGPRAEMAVRTRLPALSRSHAIGGGPGQDQTAHYCWAVPVDLWRAEPNGRKRFSLGPLSPAI